MERYTIARKVIHSSAAARVTLGACPRWAEETDVMNRMMLVSALALAAAMPAARAESADTHLSLIDRLRDAARAPIIRVDLMCGTNENNSKNAADQRGGGWTCQYVYQWKQWCLIPPGQ
jgi:hypothetical protein